MAVCGGNKVTASPFSSHSCGYLIASLADISSFNLLNALVCQDIWGKKIIKNLIRIQAIKILLIYSETGHTVYSFFSNL